MKTPFFQKSFLLGLSMLITNMGFAQAVLDIKVDEQPAQQHLAYRAITVENISLEPQAIKDIKVELIPESVSPLVQFCDQHSTCEKNYLNTCHPDASLAPHEQCTIWLRALPQDPVIPDTHGQVKLDITTQDELIAPIATTFNFDYSQDVYAGGSFNSPSLNIARWNGIAWQALSTGLPGGEVMQLASYQGDLYATGSFFEAGDKPVNFIAKWNGEQWQNLGDGMSDPGADALAVYKNSLFVGGGFDWAGEQSANYLARWNTQNWQGFELGMDAPINVLVANTDHLYVGGEFTQVSEQSAEHIAVESDNRWHPVGTGVDGSVRALALNPQGALFVGGLFNHAGSLSTAHIAKWEHNMWFPLGNGVNENVLALAVDRDRVFAGGKFTQAGDNPVNFVAQWDGARWAALDGGVTFAKQPKYTEIRALTLQGQQLYVGGYFTQAHNKDNSINAHYIAVWDRDTAQWRALGDGVDGAVRSIVVLPSLKITHSQQLAK